MSDELDEKLRSLGEGTPFPVDWRAYEVELLRRIAVAQQQQRRRTWMFALAGTGFGAAAMFLVMVLVFRPANVPQKEIKAQTPPQTIQQEPPPPPAIEEHLPIDAGTVAQASPRSATPDAAPFTRRIVRKDGRVAEIRFGGFSRGDAGNSEANFISVSDSKVR